MRRRVLWLFTLWMMCAAVLAGRLFVIATFPNTFVPQMSHSAFSSQPRTVVDLEHLQVIQTDDARGRILFRNGLPWSGEWVRMTPSHTMAVGVHKEAGQSVQVSPVVGRVGLPDVWPNPHRVVPEQGRSGLEYTFDAWLRGNRPGYVGRVKDAKNHVYRDAWYDISAIPGTSLRTTIDLAWQNAADTALKNAGVTNGAVVVLDAKTGQALAIAGVDTNHSTAIPAVRDETPGSIFKIVTGAAALEGFRVQSQSRYICRGRVDLPGVRMKCWSRHGDETFIQAFANSCDVAFASIGVKIGRGAMEEMSRRLHLTGTGLQTVDGHSVLAEAEPGRVFDRRGADAGLLANTAIGQEDVRISPLVAANIAAVIARGGLYRDVQLVLDAEQHGNVVRSFASQSAGHRALSPYVASRLAVSMRLVVTAPTGTAHDLANLTVPAAVKTGTAELGSSGLVNGWIVGFAPFDRPKVAFSVFVGRTKSETAHRAIHEVTRALVDELAKLEGWGARA